MGKKGDHMSKVSRKELQELKQANLTPDDKIERR